MEWFIKNVMEANLSKFQFMLISLLPAHQLYQHNKKY